MANVPRESNWTALVGAIPGAASTRAWPDEMTVISQSYASIEARLRRVEAEIISLREQIEQQPKVSSSQLLDLGDPRYLLNCPLPVIIESYSDEVVASIPEFDLYASGVSDTLSLAKLKAEVVSTYERLVELGPEKLGPMPRGWLAAMNRIIKIVYA